jgi:ribose 5-phosphate isomerase B
MKGFEQYHKAVLGCDHAGFAMKNQIKEYLQENDFEIRDLNPEYQNPIHFVYSAQNVCRAILNSKSNNILGFLICGTGIGISMAANRFKGIRAALLYSDFAAEYSRRHNNANILAFGGRTMDIEDVKRRIRIFLTNEFEAGKYDERNMILDEELEGEF